MLLSYLFQVFNNDTHIAKTPPVFPSCSILSPSIPRSSLSQLLDFINLVCGDYFILKNVIIANP